MFREGIISINKPEDWTSQDVCAKLRGRLHIKRIGHTGTLDPMATGVLPVCIGRATRIIEYFDMDIKKYRAVVKLGVETDTLDITGEVIKETPITDVAENKIYETINTFIGEIEQIPPKYSAVKVNGKRAYDLAREGMEVEIKPRKIHIYSIENIEIDLENAKICFDVSCSKGTYIRTLADDIGRKLGCGATLAGLTRLASGIFDIENAFTIDEIVQMSDDEINNLIIPADETLENLGIIELDNDTVSAYKNGNQILSGNFRITQETNFNNIYRIYSNQAFQGTAKIENNILKPEKVITFGNI